ncbi:signal transduction histidine kinase [Sphingomonas naasensis]|uniref:histidine kinase n=1 Tax=Sphingomonas naasensis TaxID=1344951 RepID=A0A4S1WEL1_9SPHN|nr:ATP-binding protein [Sphingomonas naasensis]NIJ19832.1 signal transduction histidine kinase [Sphingomonas naasensis]TGX40037.1 HAMP domain-containing protein [Sphingomonas naasensis]
MKAIRGAARSPLFLRIFLLMLVCVAVVQLMNLTLLVAVQTPSAKLYTIGQIAHAMEQGRDPMGDLAVERVAAVRPAGWNPRGERIEAALATALGTSADAVRVSFPPPFLQRERVFQRSAVPRPPAITPAVARDVIVIGDFSAAWRQPDGRWLRVEPIAGFEPWRWFVLLWLIISAIAVAPFAWALAHRFAKPIRAFAGAAERLGRDPRAPPLELEGPAEIAEAAAAFNTMQARLNRYVDDRTTVISAVAHDLRTPLMRLALRLEAAPDSLRQACEGDIRDMQGLVSTALAYVRETNQKPVRRPLDLRSLTETVVDDLADRGEAVTFAPGDPVVFDGNPAAIKALVTNLITNAVKYAGSADLSLERIDGHAVLEVRDRGPGIPPEDLEHVFEPFFRGERSRNRDTGGVGLGLPSARAVARAHGGDVELANRAGGGLVATVSLPV